MTTKSAIYVHTRDGGMTKEQYDDLHARVDAAEKRGDSEEYDRLLHFVPLSADVAKAFRNTYGRDFLVSTGFDLTEADMKFGKGWLDEEEEE
jgi:hypothetical protein